jgi:hypothetical protein
MNASSDLRGSFEQTFPGTLYWTISLYIPAERLAAALDLPKSGRGEARRIVEPDVWRRLTMKHRCSLALGGAMDPLFNDIADRDVQGMAQEFLIAAMDDPTAGATAMQSARKQVLDEVDVTFRPPRAARWMTEGREYEATPPGLCEPRTMALKRFWFAHYGGALSYHLSFRYRYRPLPEENDARAGPLGDGYTPANYYFLSMLQKLVAPKELSLPIDLLMGAADRSDASVSSVFDQVTGIALLDYPIVTGLAPGKTSPTTFWHGLEFLFNQDAGRLVRRLDKDLSDGAPGAKCDINWREALLEDQPVIEVPGLGMPRCRFMFFFHDDRFFGRLMPMDASHRSVERKTMVQDDCYQPYLEKIAQLRREAKADPVAMDQGYWQWVGSRADEYAAWCSDGTIVPKDETTPFGNMSEWAEAIRSGNCKLTIGADGRRLELPVPLHIPAYETGRTDCLDYLFLSGFNQNIIDFMNQDTSEILDSTDPLYPERQDQQDERFFVRFANHRALLTYVPSSRSLEIGNDYIGTCPYAFLIHVLAMHNEYLDRLHETATASRIARIEDRLNPGYPTELNSKALLEIEDLINMAKLANYREYKRYRYINPFRYDTERDVFEKLENLRGTSRKQQALEEALASLEDHADDLARQSRRAEVQREQRYEKKVTTGFAIVGLAGIIQMIYALITIRLDKSYLVWPMPLNHGKTLNKQAIAAEGLVAIIASLFAIVVIVYLVNLLIRDRFRSAVCISGIGLAMSAIYFYLSH